MIILLCQMSQNIRDRQIAGCQKKSQRFIVFSLLVWIWGSLLSSRRAACWLRHSKCKNDFITETYVIEVTVNRAIKWVPWVLQMTTIDDNKCKFRQFLAITPLFTGSERRCDQVGDIDPSRSEGSKRWQEYSRINHLALYGIRSNSLTSPEGHDIIPTVV